MSSYPTTRKAEPTCSSSSPTRPQGHTHTLTFLPHSVTHAYTHPHIFLPHSVTHAYTPTPPHTHLPAPLCHSCIHPTESGC